MYKSEIFYVKYLFEILKNQLSTQWLNINGIHVITAAATVFKGYIILITKILSYVGKTECIKKDIKELPLTSTEWNWNIIESMIVNRIYHKKYLFII